MIPRCFQSILQNSEGRGTPSTALLQLFSIVEVPHDGTLVGMAEAAQSWQTDECLYQIRVQFGDKLDVAIPMLDALGLRSKRRLSEEDLADLRTSDVVEVAICGGRLVAMQERLIFANETLPPDLYIRLATLGSIRGLDPDEIEAWSKMGGKEHIPQEFLFPTIEADLALGLSFAHADLLRTQVRMEFYQRICAPSRRMPKKLPMEEIRRWRPEPGLSETIDTWKDLRKCMGMPLDGTQIVIVTDGPAWDRTERITQRTFPESTVRCIGCATPMMADLSQYFKEVALLLEECSNWLQPP